MPKNPRPKKRETPIERFLSRLKDVRPIDGGYSACCPAHADSSPSLSVSEDEEGKVLLCCHAGCEASDVVKAMGLKWADLFPQAESRKKKATTSAPNPAKTPAPVVMAPGEDVFSLPKPTLTNSPGPGPDWVEMQREFMRACTPRRREYLSDELGVSVSALKSVRVGYSEDDTAYTFPEYSASGDIIGINRRFVLDGRKRTIGGSSRGLTLPRDLPTRDGPIMIVEGATDTAAAWDLGFAAIGRPSAAGGAFQLACLLKGVPEERPIIVLGEIDPKPDGKWPGFAGATLVARKISETLGREVAWALPPSGAKDIRAWVQEKCCA